MDSRDVCSAVVHPKPSLLREVGSTWDAGEQEQDFIRNVIPHLRNATENFKELATILLDYDESKKRALQQVTLQGKQSLDLADSAASAQLSAVDQYTESLTAMKGQLDQQQRDKRKDLENLKTESESITNLMEKSRVALSDAESSLYHARQTLNELEDKRRESETVRDVGIGLMLIPIIGTIAGAIMVGVSQKELDDANWAISRAEDVVRDNQNSVKNYNHKIEDIKQQRTQKEEQLAQCGRSLVELKQKLVHVQSQRNNITRTQEKLRSAVNVVDTLVGRASVAKTLTERVVCLPTVANMLGEIIQLMLETQGDRKYELLKDPQVKAAILSLQEMYQKVSAIDDQQTLKEIDFYC